MIKTNSVVVVGMGFIGGFLLPGYEMLLGDRVATDVSVIKATDRDLEKLRAEYPFRITVGNTLEVLREKKPDILVMCPPPAEIPVIIKDTLVPYFNEARAAGTPLPDIYTFGPVPDPRYYYDCLGPGIHCAKFLPSMMETVGGVHLQKYGGSFLVFTPGDPFPPDRRQRAIDFSNLFGRTFIIPHDQSLYALAAKNTAHTLFEISYAVSEALQELGHETATSGVGAAMLSLYREFMGGGRVDVCEGSLKEVPDAIIPFLKGMTKAWYNGILSYLLAAGCEKDLARDFHGANFESLLCTVRLATRKELEKSTANHATKGGVNEKAIEVFMGCFYGPLRKAARLHMEGGASESFYDVAEGMAYTINQTVHRHAYRLAGKF